MVFQLEPGRTAWVLVCMGLVQLMLPGLAFFYAGFLNELSVITMMMQNYSAMGVVFAIWFLFGFSLCFGQDSNSVVGSPFTYGGFKDVDGNPLFGVHNACFGSSVTLELMLL